MHGAWRKGILALIAAAMVLAVLLPWPLCSGTQPFPNLIRIHVLANSDSPTDQALKLRVRDAVVQQTAPLFQEARTVEEAREVARANLGSIREVAEREVRAAGKDYPVTVSMGCYHFPARTYHLSSGDITLPAGDYEAVRVVLGRGEGANWWCVLFPPLCFVELQPSVPDGSLREAVAGVPGAEYQPAFKWLDSPGMVHGSSLRPGEPEGAVEFRLRLVEVVASSSKRLRHFWGS